MIMAKRRKRGNGEGSVFRSGGKWKAVITVGYKPDGTRIRRSRSGLKSHAKATETLRKLQKEYEDYSPDASESEDLTLSEYLDYWLENIIKPERADNTYESYGLSIKNYLSSRLGGVLLSKLKPLQIQSMFSDLAKEGKGSRTRENCYIVLNSALNKAIQLGLISANPCTPIDKPKYTPGEMFPFTMEEYKTILKETKDEPYHALIVLALTMGFRFGELAGLKWENVDFKERTIHIKQQLIEIKGGLKLKEPKSKSSIRTVDMPDKAYEVLLDHKKEQLKSDYTDSKFVFLAPDGTMLRRTNFMRRVWKERLKDAKIKHRGFHHTRHFFATEALSAGVPIPVVSKILGHSKVSVTLDVYAHVLDQHTEKSTKVLSKIFEA